MTELVPDDYFYGVFHPVKYHANGCSVGLSQYLTIIYIGEISVVPSLYVPEHPTFGTLSLISAFQRWNHIVG